MDGRNSSTILSNTKLKNVEPQLVLNAKKLIVLIITMILKKDNRLLINSTKFIQETEELQQVKLIYIKKQHYMLYLMMHREHKQF